MGTYTPTATRSWEQFVQFQALEHAPKYLPECPVELHAIFTFERPKSLPKKVTYHIKKPDADNVLKAVSDALEGIFYKNDNQIFKLSTSKRYQALVDQDPVGVQVELIYHDEKKEEGHGRKEKSSRNKGAGKGTRGSAATGR
jgi:Holliday junction resolvase RusA-like endonuclease